MHLTHLVHCIFYIMYTLARAFRIEKPTKSGLYIINKRIIMIKQELLV